MKILVKILLITLWIAIAAGIVLMMGFANDTHQVKQCRGITCRVDYRGATPLMSGNELIAQINREFGKLESKTLGEIDIAGISNLVKNNPYLENTDVLLTVEGDVLIRADQCIPTIRYYSTAGYPHYIDKEGRIMPVNTAYPCKVLIASGIIESPLKDGRNIFAVSDSNKVLKAQPKTCTTFTRLQV